MNNLKNTIEFCFVLIFNNAFYHKLTLLEESSKRLARTTPDNVRYEVLSIAKNSIIFEKIPYSWSYVWQTCENIRVLEFNVVHHGFKYKLHAVNKYCSSKHYNISKKKWFNYWFLLIFAILWISLSYCFIIFANKRIV